MSVENMKSVGDIACEILMFIQNLEIADDAYEFVRLYLLSLVKAGWTGSVGAVYASIAEVDERFSSYLRGRLWKGSSFL